MNAIADMNVADLRALAREQGLKGYSKMRKAELVEALQPAQEQQQQPPSRGSGPGGLVAGDDRRKARNTAKRRRTALRARGFQAGF